MEMSPAFAISRNAKLGATGALLAAVGPVVVAIHPPGVAGVATHTPSALGHRIRQIHETWRCAGAAEAQVVVVWQPGLAAVI